MSDTPDKRDARLDRDAANCESLGDRRLSEDSSRKAVFELVAQQPAPNVIVEFIDFLLHNKKWWLTPIILVLLVFSVFIALTSSALAPFIYVLF